MIFLRMIAAAALFLCGAAARAETAASAARYVVTYLEVGAPATRQAVALLRRMAAESRRQAGNAGYEVLQDSCRPNRFAVVESWRDQQALDAHRAAQANGPAARLQALLVSPPDRRPSTALSLAPAGAAPPRGALYVLTHVDVVPPAKEQAIRLVEAFAADSRKDGGNLSFDVLDQESRPNHMTLVEAWRSDKAFEAHVTAAHSREFREKLLPLQGALYDERLYRALP
jgi:quinol monooxygenase YgiN